MAIVRVWTNPDQKEWLVNTETRKVAPAENGCVWSTSGKPLCLEDFREPGRTAVLASDSKGRGWLLNLETFRAVPAIAGGDDELDPLPFDWRYCSGHDILQRLSRFEDDEISEAANMNVVVWYCPILWCDTVRLRGGGASSHRTEGPTKNRLLLLIAARQKAFFRKFAEQFAGNGK